MGQKRAWEGDFGVRRRKRRRLAAQIASDKVSADLSKTRRKKKSEKKSEISSDVGIKDKKEKNEKAVDINTKKKLNENPADVTFTPQKNIPSDTGTYFSAVISTPPPSPTPNSAVTASPPSPTQQGLGGLPKVRWSDIKLGDELGSGGFGATYEAILNLPDSEQITVAVKILHLGMWDDLMHEARVLKDVAGAGGSPRLYGVTRGCPKALVMELCRGITLDHYMDKVKDPTQRKNVLRKCRLAVEEFHKAGYAHCDLHGDNVIVDINDNDRIQLIDMGLARKLTPQNENLLTARDFRARIFRDYDLEDVYLFLICLSVLGDITRWQNQIDPQQNN